MSEFIIDPFKFGAPPFSPSDISGLKFWLAADSLGLSDGAAVGTWTDLSGLGNNFTQGTSGNKPTYKTGIIGGQPVVRFDDTDDYMGSSFSNSGPNTVVVVFRINETGSYALFQGDRYLYGDDLTMHRMYNGGAQLDGPAVTQNTPYITVTRWNGASSKLNRSDTATTYTGTVTGGWSSSTTIGGGGGRQGSDIAEMLYYDSAISDADMESLGNYLAAKYGLTWTP